MADADWKVVCEPVGENPGLVEKAKAGVRGATGQEPENVSGMIIYVQNGPSGAKQEVARVSYIRRKSVCKNPKNSFEKQLGIIVKKAQSAVAMLNSDLTSDGSIQ